jgi:hypothetical protein
MSTEWGNNPATLEAIGTVVSAVGVFAVFISTLLAWRALKETKAQRHAIEREIAVRMRPWVGLFGFAFHPSDSVEDKLTLCLRNFGALPAQRAALSLTMRPVKAIDNEPDNPVKRQEQGAKVLLPGEEGNYAVPLSQYPQFGAWRRARRDVRIEGTFTYAVDQLEFGTELEATIWFSESAFESDKTVRINWRNRSAS